MFNSTVLDVAIGLAFLYLLLGLMCTTVNEWIAGVMKLRAKNLELGIRRLLTAPSDGTQLIRPVDLKNAGKLLVELATGTGELTAFIRSQFDDANKALITSYVAGETPTPAMVTAVCAELNKQVQNKDLFTESRFPQRSMAVDQIKKQLQTGQVAATNRKLLEDAYPDMIGTLTDDFYGHPLIKSLIPINDVKGSAAPGQAHPSYVPARTFALAVMDIVIKGQQGPTDFKTLLRGIQAMPDSDVKLSLLALMQNIDAEVPGALATAQARIEGWFNDAMDRVSGAYKRRTQVLTVIVAVLITIASNADTVQIANKLFISPALRDTVVAAARERAAGPKPLSDIEYTDPTDPKPSLPVDAAGSRDTGEITSKQRELLGQFSGWANEFRVFNQMVNKTTAGESAYDCVAGRSTTPECAAALKKADMAGDSFPGLQLVTQYTVTPVWLWYVVPMHLVGWLLSAIAISLGAPFWFDTLNRFMNIRAAGKSPDEAPKGAEKKVA